MGRAKGKAQAESADRVSEIMASVNAALGTNALQRANDARYTVSYIPTGVLPIDDLLQGGLPRGRFTEIYGDYSSLKSYIGLRAIAEVQKSGGTAALIDTEHAFDPAWAANLGVDLNALMIPPLETGEQAMDACEVMMRNNIDLIVFDSVAAALPKSERDLQLSGDKNVQPARLAQLMSLAMRKLTAANGKTAILWINQTRLNVGVTFGNPETIPGGKSLPYYASYRISLKKAGKITEAVKAVKTDANGKPETYNTKLTTGQSIRATVEKSKLSAPFKEVFFTFDYRKGEIDVLSYLVNLGIERGVVLHEGQMWWLKNQTQKTRGYDAFRLGLTVEAVKEALEDKPVPDGPRVVRRKKV